MKVYVGVDPSTEGRCYAMGLSEVGAVVYLPLLGQTGRSTVQLLREGVGLLHGSGVRVIEVGVEVPVFLYRGGSVGSALLSTGATAGACIGWVSGHPSVSKCVGVSPEEWRKWLTGKRNPSDAVIKQALESRLVLPRRTNEHVRDALGVALWLQAVGRSASASWARWESGSGWSSASSATAGSTRTAKPHRPGSTKPSKSPETAMSTYRPRSQPSPIVPEPGAEAGHYKLLVRTDGLYFVWDREAQKRVSPFLKSKAAAEGLLRGLAGE